METNFVTHRDVLDLWRRRRDVLATAIGRTRPDINQYYHHNRIPSRLWLAVERAAQAEGMTAVTVELLGNLKTGREHVDAAA
jgi:hypothetical protein